MDSWVPLESMGSHGIHVGSPNGISTSHHNGKFHVQLGIPTGPGHANDNMEFPRAFHCQFTTPLPLGPEEAETKVANAACEFPHHVGSPMYHYYAIAPSVWLHPLSAKISTHSSTTFLNSSSRLGLPACMFEVHVCVRVCVCVHV